LKELRFPKIAFEIFCPLDSEIQDSGFEPMKTLMVLDFPRKVSYGVHVVFTLEYGVSCFSASCLAALMMSLEGPYYYISTREKYHNLTFYCVLR
jgi:hypothetical protein